MSGDNEAANEAVNNRNRQNLHTKSRIFGMSSDEMNSLADTNQQKRRAVSAKAFGIEKVAEMAPKNVTKAENSSQIARQDSLMDENKIRAQDKKVSDEKFRKFNLNQ